MSHLLRANPGITDFPLNSQGVSVTLHATGVEPVRCEIEVKTVRVVKQMMIVRSLSWYRIVYPIYKFNTLFEGCITVPDQIRFTDPQILQAPADSWNCTLTNTNDRDIRRLQQSDLNATCCAWS